MADITVVTTDIRPLVSYVSRRLDTGGTVAVGEAVYIDSNGAVIVADADTQAYTHARGIVIACPDGALTIGSGNPVDVCVFGPVTGFTGMTQGAVVYVSSTDGNMTHTIPATPDYDHAIGYAESDVTIFVNPSSVLPPIGS